LPKVFAFFTSSLPQKFFLLPTYLPSFCTHSIIKALNSGELKARRWKKEGRIKSQKEKGRSGNHDKMLAMEG
jgi:hypothetical protein